MVLIEAVAKEAITTGAVIEAAKSEGNEAVKVLTIVTPVKIIANVFGIGISLFVSDGRIINAWGSQAP